MYASRPFHFLFEHASFVVMEVFSFRDPDFSDRLPHYPKVANMGSDTLTKEVVEAERAASHGCAGGKEFKSAM